MRDLAVRSARADELALVLDIDDDATRRYTSHGFSLGLLATHPFAIAEQKRWEEALGAGLGRIAEQGGLAAGVAILGIVDEAPYLDQLSVRFDQMGQGVGGALLEHALRWAAPRGGLTLTTYRHLPWNRPFYEKRGLVEVPESAWGPELRAIVEAQRAALPDPDQRMVMRAPV